MPPRILLCGDVFGRLNQLFKRVSSVNKSAGPFDALFCVGQFFPDSPEQLDEFMAYVEGSSQIPIPTYFIGDYGVGSAKVLLAASKDSANRGFKMDGLRVRENLFWLKGSGNFSLFGLCVAYLSGRKSPEGQQFGTYSQDDVDALRAIAEDPGIVDLFLTNEWPTGVTNRASDIPAGFSDSIGSDSTISELVQEIKPRYHIAGTKGIYYTREPYSNVDAVHVTRFIGLASVGNKDKQKFIHALSPTPASTMSSTEIAMKTTNSTLSPYTLMEKSTSPKDVSKRSGDVMSDDQYWRYDVSQKRRRHDAGEGEKICFKFVSSGSCPRGEKCNFRHDGDAREQYKRGVCFDFLNKGKCERGPDCSFKHSLQNEGDMPPSRRPGSENTRSKECWFCLSSPNVESHLIISIGENYYLALAKGPLVEDHVLIVPVEHMPSTLSLSSESEVELCRFQNSLQRYCKSQGKEVIFFEWVSIRGTHANLQAIPIPSSKAVMVEKAFNLAAQKMGFKFVSKNFDSISDGRKFLKTQADGESSLFYAEIPGGTILLHRVEEKVRFPAQFGREVLAGLLNMADNADWRNRKHNKEEEMKIVEDFKSRFQEYDPNC